MREGELTRHLEDEMIDFCEKKNHSLSAMLAQYNNGNPYIDDRGDPENLFLTVVNGTRVLDEFYDQIKVDGRYAFGLIHQYGLTQTGIGAYMAVETPNEAFSTAGHYWHELRMQGFDIPQESLFVTQLQGPLKEFVDKSPYTHRSPRINPVSNALKTRIPWEFFFLDLSILFAHHIQKPRVYVIPAENNTYYVPEAAMAFERELSIQEYGEVLPVVIKRQKMQRHINHTLVMRYNETPKRMGWSRLNDHGPWYRNV